MLKKKDRVTWTGKGRGSVVTRTGTVEEIVPAGKTPPGSYMDIVGYQPARTVTSYIVREDPPATTKRAKGKLFWPRAELTKLDLAHAA